MRVSRWAGLPGGYAPAWQWLGVARRAPPWTAAAPSWSPSATRVRGRRRPCSPTELGASAEPPEKLQALTCCSSAWYSTSSTSPPAAPPPPSRAPAVAWVCAASAATVAPRSSLASSLPPARELWAEASLGGTAGAAAFLAAGLGGGGVPSGSNSGLAGLERGEHARAAPVRATHLAACGVKPCSASGGCQ
jgi:hypothetical protein